MNGLRLAALDLSLSSSGVARTAALAGTDTYPAAVTTIRAGDRTGHERLENILISLACLHLAHAQLVAIERPFDNPNTPGTNMQLAGLHAHVTHYLWRNDVPYVYVSPLTLKVYALGKGRGEDVTKKAVLAAVRTTYADAVSFVDNSDEGDALALLGLACDAYGEPLAPVPAPHRRAIKAVGWPELRRPRPDVYVPDTLTPGGAAAAIAGPVREQPEIMS